MKRKAYLRKAPLSVTLPAALLAAFASLVLSSEPAEAQAMRLNLGEPASKIEAVSHNRLTRRGPNSGTRHGIKDPHPPATQQLAGGRRHKGYGYHQDRHHGHKFHRGRHHRHGGYYGKHYKRKFHHRNYGYHHGYRYPYGYGYGYHHGHRHGHHYKQPYYGNLGDRHLYFGLHYGYRY